MKENGPKQKKKAKRGGQVEFDANNNNGKRTKTASTGKGEQRNMSVTEEDEKAPISHQDSGK